MLPFIPASAKELDRDQYSRMAEKTDHLREVIEAPLEQVARNRVEAAYARSGLFERPRVLVDDWARYLAKGSGDDPEPAEKEAATRARAKPTSPRQSKPG